jgi:hypothetical protein
LAKAKQGIGRFVATDSSVVKVDSTLWIPSVEIGFHILSVEALMRNAVTQEYKAVPILKFDLLRNA